MKFEKGNTKWMENKEFKSKMGRLTPEIVNSEEFQRNKQKGHDRYRALNRLKKDIFKQMTGEDKISKGIDSVLDKAIEGDTKQFVDLLKLIAPKEIDITSGGKRISMGTIKIDGDVFKLKIGDDVSSSVTECDDIELNQEKEEEENNG